MSLSDPSDLLLLTTLLLPPLFKEESLHHHLEVSKTEDGPVTPGRKGRQVIILPHPSSAQKLSHRILWLCSRER